MSTKEKKNSNKLSREILGLILLALLISVVAYFLLYSIAGTLAYDYCEKHQIALDALESIVLDSMVVNGSLVGAIVLFVILFLIFVGNKLSYLKEVIAGIHALRTHRMEYEIPLKGHNEMTELAESINYLAETERQLKAIQRNLSHDIRTPLTAILSYAEYMQSRDDLTKEELNEFLELTKRKAEQIKVLTDQLLDKGVAMTEIEDGKLLMAQLAEEWAESLEETFDCRIDLSSCPDFNRQLDIDELRRIFDNLASNVEKYAETSAPVNLEITKERGRIAIRQSNRKAKEQRLVESRKIGLTSIDNIAKHYGGSGTVAETDEHFAIEIILFEV